MPFVKKLLDQIRCEPANVRFADLMKEMRNAN